MTSQKHHPRLGQINHLGHVGCVQNDWTTFLAIVQNGFFFINFFGQINREFL